MNSEDKYIAVYGRDGSHISNIELSKWNITKKVFDLDVSNFEGSCDEDITSGLIFVMNDKYGNKEYSGFMKGIVQDKKTGHVTFKGEDLRSIWDTQVLLDFTPFNNRRNYTLENMFKLVRDAILDQASSIITINIIVPSDSTSTQAVGRFDGTYTFTNAQEFLKTYLAYFNYYLTADFDIDNQKIDFEFVKATTTRTVRLDDFIFTQTTSEIKTNHTVARIKSDINLQPVKTWVYCSKSYYDSLDQSMKLSELEVQTASQIPLDPETLPDGFGFRGSNQVPEDTYYYWKVAKVEHVWQLFHPIYADPSGQDYWNSYDSTQRLSENYSSTPYVGNPELDPNNYELGVPLKITYPYYTEYYKVILNTQELSDTIQQTRYYLGLDNEIYINSILENNQIYPVKTKYYEDEYFAKAQFNAIWELVNSRYNENVIIDEVNAPVDIKTYNLFDMITVYDSNGDLRELPVSEIKWTNKSYTVKLGFKKEKFTDLVKEVTGTKSSGAISIKSPFKLIKDIGRLGNLSDIQ